MVVTQFLWQLLGLALQIPLIAVSFNFFCRKQGCENSRYPPLYPLAYTAILVAMYNVGPSLVRHYSITPIAR